jgi:toxin ParE1/3/4
LDRIDEAIESLAVFPERGPHPQELLVFGLRDFRQLVVHPYRIIYRVLGQQVFVDLIADGRRDMQTLLARRLL